MANRYTRRRILGRGVKASLAALGSTGLVWNRTVKSVWAEVERDKGAVQNSALSPEQRLWLVAVADQIVPESDGMPGPSKVGAGGYIEVVLREVTELRDQVIAALEWLAESSKSKFQKELGQLNAAELVELLKALERESNRSSETEGLAASRKDLFSALRDLVYEAYYTNPKIWERLGYDFNTTEDGAELKVFDERILSVVRQRPENYRRVDQ